MMLQQIRRCEDAWREMSSEKRRFSDNLERWHHHTLPDRYDCNAFIPNGKLTAEDIQLAENYQKEQGLDFLQFFCRQPLDKALMEHFSLEETIVLTMALQNGELSQWKKNPDIEIKDVQTHNIATDIIAFHVEQEKEDFGDSDYPLRQMTSDMSCAKENANYHWICAYEKGELLGICHAFCHNGCVEVDDLVVTVHARRRYIATTMFRYIAEHFEGQLYLHADADGTSRHIYEKMGFVPVDTCWEYRKTW